MTKYIIIGVLVIVLIYTLVTYNGLIRLRNKLEEAFSTMDVYLKKRWDLVPNLVETVKGYAKHEKETFENVVNLRSSSYDNLSQDDKMDINNKLSAGITKIMALAESYPDLKASDNFLNLSANLSKTEEDIANSRKYYNAVVKLMNNKVQMFPSNIIAKLFGFKASKMYEVSESERENVKVDF